MRRCPRLALCPFLLALSASASAAPDADEHRSLHRVFAYVGFAPAMVTLLDATGDVAHEDAWRFRQRAVTLGAAYRHHFLRWLGLHAGASAGVGRTQIGISQDGNFTDCCSFSSKQVAPSFSLDLEVAPLFGPFGRSFYLSPGLMTRLFFPLEASATLTDEEGETRSVRFPAPTAATGGRLALGFMFGAHGEFDLGAGLDMAYAYGRPEGYFGLFLRFGVAFGDLATD